jgi:hypothetical protein
MPIQEMWRASTVYVAAEEGGLATKSLIGANLTSGDGGRTAISEQCINAVYSLQKLADLFRDGDGPQIEFAIGELEQLFQNCITDTLLIVIPVVCEQLLQWTPHLQLMAGNELLRLKAHVVNEHVSRVLALSAILVIHGTSNIPDAAAIYEVYGKIIIGAVPNVDWPSNDLRPIFSFIDQYIESPFSADRRIAACFVLGLCNCSQSDEGVRRSAQLRLWRLVKDPSSEVMARCLETFTLCASSFSMLRIEDQIWPIVRKPWIITQDGHWLKNSAMAKIEAIHCVLALCKANDKQGTRQSALFRTLVPSFVRDVTTFANHWCLTDQRDASPDIYQVEVAVSKLYGELVHFAVRDNSRALYQREVLSAYAGMSASNGPLVRKNCAYNLPGMSVTMAKFRAALPVLATCCRKLAADDDDQVRLTIAKGLHETSRALATRSTLQQFHGSLRKLFEDDNYDVRMAVLKNLKETLRAFRSVESKNPLQSLDFQAALHSAVASLEDGDWRMAEEFATQLQLSAGILASSVLDTIVVPALQRLLVEGAFRVRRASAASLITCVRAIPSASSRDEYIRSMMAAMATANSHHMRITLIDSGLFAMTIFSEDLFVKLFAGTILQLADDSVPIVRARLAYALPRFAPWCQGMSMFEVTLAKLYRDDDKDVQRAMLVYVAEASKCVADCRRMESVHHATRIAEISFYKTEILQAPALSPSAPKGTKPPMHNSPAWTLAAIAHALPINRKVAILKRSSSPILQDRTDGSAASSRTMQPRRDLSLNISSSPRTSFQDSKSGQRPRRSIAAMPDGNGSILKLTERPIAQLPVSDKPESDVTYSGGDDIFSARSLDETSASDFDQQPRLQKYASFSLTRTEQHEDALFSMISSDLADHQDTANLAPEQPLSSSLLSESVSWTTKVRTWGGIIRKTNSSTRSESQGGRSSRRSRDSEGAQHPIPVVVEGQSILRKVWNRAVLSFKPAAPSSPSAIFYSSPLSRSTSKTRSSLGLSAPEKYVPAFNGTPPWARAAVLTERPRVFNEPQEFTALRATKAAARQELDRVTMSEGSLPNARSATANDICPLPTFLVGSRDLLAAKSISLDESTLPSRFSSLLSQWETGKILPTA